MVANNEISVFADERETLRGRGGLGVKTNGSHFSGGAAILAAGRRPTRRAGRSGDLAGGRPGDQANFSPSFFGCGGRSRRLAYWLAD